MPERKLSKIKSSYSTIKYFRRKVLGWVYRKPRHYPWRSSRIKFHSLVAEILLQRTKAEQVTPVYKTFIKIYPSPAALAAGSLARIKMIIAPLGLKWRAQKLKELAEVLKTRYRGIIPCCFDDLIDLPGVGPYVASAYLSLHNNKRALLVDSNIVRLYGRFFGFKVHAESRRNRTLMNLIDLLTPPHECRRFNYTVLDLGRNICQPKPLCPLCPVSSKCHYYNSGKG